MRFRILLPLLGLIAGCASAGAADDPPQVLAAAYPFAWAAEQVAGPDARVVSLVRPGAEPHDVELSPRQVGAVEKASLVVYLRGFQPAVDDAVRNSSRSARLDLTPYVDVQPLSSDLDDETGTGTDPHVWLDPVRMSAVVRALKARLAQADPSHAVDYTTRAARVTAELRALDELFRRRLADCDRHDVVTAHTAFAYLAGRYGLRQVGVTGLAPDNEPAPGHIAEVAQYARAHGVRTVFFESRIDPKLAETVAREIDACTAVLDPVEGVQDGDDYLSVMRRNAAALAEGLGCR
ncbi:MAG: metal ABC transporter substrate-binding protein [Mycobacteriales bacterium]